MKIYDKMLSMKLEVLSIYLKSIELDSINPSDLIGSRGSLFRMQRHGINKREFSFTIVSVHEENL